MITNIYVLICVCVFLYIRFINKDVDKLSCVLRIGAFYPPQIREKHEFWRFLTCHFIHIDFLHLICNMYGLYYLGHFFESLLGTVSYILLIAISMLLSAMLCYSASEISSKYDYTVTYGASGVVFGFFGAICALGLLLGGVYQELLMGYFNVIVINLLYTLFNKHVSKTGHLGGFIGGIASIIILLAFQMI